MRPAAVEKIGADDFIASGHTEADLMALPREALGAATPLFTPVGDQNGSASSALAVQRHGLDLSIECPSGVRLTLSAIRDGRDGVRGELTVTQGGRRLSWGAFTPSSTVGREGLRKKLQFAAPGAPWGEYLEDAAWLFTQAVREGEPLTVLTGQVRSATRELVPGLLYAGDPTLVYADGDTGKSLFALTLAAAVRAGVALPFGLKPVQPVPVAYLDWETSKDTLDERLGLVAAGFGIAVPDIYYKRMVRPLVDEAGDLAAKFAQLGIGLVIVDSQIFAIGTGEGGAFHEPITAFYAALRLFAPAAPLILSHITNGDARAGTPGRPFGGAFAFNGPRLIWEARRDHEVGDATAIAFTCKKANNLARRPDPFGLRFASVAGAITVEPFNLVEAAPHAVAGTSVAYRITLALAGNGAGNTAKELAERTGSKETVVRRTLERMQEKGEAQPVPDSKPQRWVLRGPR